MSSNLDTWQVSSGYSQPGRNSSLRTLLTAYTQARDNFVKVLEQVEQGDSIVRLHKL